MATVGVIGGKTDRQVSNILNAVQFYCDLLLPKEIGDTLEIDVDLDEELDIIGCMIVSGEDEYPPKEFTITVNPNSRESIYRTIAHEMVHVKQYALGELRDEIQISLEGFRHNSVWKEVPHLTESHESIFYYDQPWELEAYGMELSLYNKWINRKYLTSA